MKSATKRSYAFAALAVVIVGVATPYAAAAQTECDLNGLWRSTLGTMRLSMVAVGGLHNPSDALQGMTEGEAVLEDGLRATITGTLDGRTGDGWVDGAVVDDRLRLQWYLPASYAPPTEAGEGYFIVTENCDSLRGAYRAGFEGDFDLPWALQRITPLLAENGTADDEPLYQTRATEMSRALSGAAALRDGLDATRYDLTARAAALAGATDSEIADAALAEMDEIAFVPYAGVLRGARGGLLAESGNAYDQSLMLAGLLNARGIGTRLVAAELTHEAAERLVDSAAEGGGDIGPPPALDDPIPPSDVLTTLGLGSEEIETRLAAIRSDRESLLRDGHAEALWHADQIIDALPASERGLDIDAAAMRETLIADARRHVWVQAELDGAWRDLDPVFADTGNTGRLAGPVEEIGEIADERYHRVNFIISIERLEDGALANEQVGAWTVRVADIMRVGVPTFRFRNVPFDVPTASGMAWDMESSTEAGQIIADALLTEPTAYRPVLMLSTGEIDIGTGFDLSGRLVADDFRVRLANETREAIAGGMEGATTAIENIFGGDAFGGGGEASAPAAPSMLTGQWLEIQWVTPDGAVRKERRAILDRIGPAARAAGATEVIPDMADDRAARMALFGGFDILATGGPIHAAWRRALRLDAVLANEGAMRRALDLQFARAPLTAEFASGLVEWPEWLYLFDPLVRAQSALAPAEGEVTLVHGEPHVVALRQNLSVDEAGRLNQGFGVDIINAAMTPVPRAETSAERVARTQINHGARVTVLEREIVAAWVARRCPDCAIEILENTSTIAAAALDDGGTLLALGPDDAASLPGFADPDAHFAAARDLLAGRLAVLPAEPVVIGGAERVAWWRIDPVSGYTLGMLSGRGGEGYTEYIIVTAMIVFGSNGVAMLGMFDQCYQFDPGPGSRTQNADGSTTWHPPTGPSTSGRGLVNCLGCALLAFTCPYRNEMTGQLECWTSASLYDYPTCASSL